MAIPPLIQTLPYVAWILLVSLSFGSFAFVVLTRQLSDAAMGYLRFTAASGAVLAFLARLVDAGLTPSSSLVIEQSGQDLATLRWLGLVLFVIGALTYVSIVRRPRAALVVGIAALLSAALTLTSAAFGWAPSTVDAVPLLVQLAVLSFVTGGSMAAIVLGHWYLVTPKISERPLILQIKLLLGGLILQAMLFVTWTTLGGGPRQTAFSAFTAGPVLLVALRLLITIAFPIALTWMAWRTARTRSMESATGLLYINFAAVLAGTIGAAALYVSNGILV